MLSNRGCYGGTNLIDLDPTVSTLPLQRPPHNRVSLPCWIVGKVKVVESRCAVAVHLNPGFVCYVFQRFSGI